MGLLRFREGVPNTADAPTRYLKAVLYHFSSVDPAHQGCAAHGSDDQAAAREGWERLKAFRQAVESGFCCGASVDLLLIGMGTGIAPFRALIKHIYQNVKDYKGRVRLFYGAQSGLELLYMNEEKDDFSQYYDQETFEAFKALSPRPNWADPIAMDYALEERSEEILSMLESPHTRVYVAGRADILDTLDRVFSHMIGSSEQWARRKAELKAGGRWVELVY